MFFITKYLVYKESKNSEVHTCHFMKIAGDFFSR